MNQIPKTPNTTTCLFLISFYIFLSSLDKITEYSTAYYVSVLSLLVAFLLSILIIFAVRTTVVACITVVVLLAFTGKRRRVLAKEGSVIASDVAFYFVKVVVNEKSLVAFSCATIVGATIMASSLRMGDQMYL